MKYPEGIDKINDQIPSQVTYDVNGGFNDLDKREAQYEKISKNIYQLTQCKPKTNE